MKKTTPMLLVSMVSALLTGCGDSDSLPAPVTELIAQFDPAKDESPEGLALSPDGKTAYAGMIGTGVILAVSLADGKVNQFGSVSPLPVEGLSVLGLATDKGGDLYVAVGSESPAYPPGIYKIAAAGGGSALFASHPDMGHPNGILFDSDGELWITDSVAGGIFKASADGKTVSLWLSHPTLEGDTTGPCTSGLSSPVGANGIAIAGGNVYVTNSDKATLIRIPIGPGGAAGTPEAVVEPDENCLPLAGPEGIVADEDGSILVATYTRSQAIVRVDPDGTTEVVVSGDPLDVPTNLTFTTRNGERGLVIANCGCGNPNPGPNPGPGLVWHGPLP